MFYRLLSQEDIIYKKRRYGLSGFVTAGHCVSRIIPSTINGFGTVRARWFGGTNDSAFVETFGSTTNTLYYSSPLGSNQLSSNVLNSYTVGQRIAKMGTSTGFSSGTITVAKYAKTLEDQENGQDYDFTDLVKSNVHIQLGDSGGIVFVYPNVVTGLPPTGGHVTAGVVTGCDPNPYSNNCANNSMFFTRADRVNSWHGTTRF